MQNNNNPNFITINGNEIKPGHHDIVMVPMPKLYDWTPLNMPIHVINGKKPGPVLCLIAAIHGDEVNGTEIIRRLLKKRLVRKLSGSLIAIPIVNIYGFLHQDRYLMDRRDLNRSFPGLETGSLAARLAFLISKEVMTQATHIIDLHAGSHHRTNLPQLRGNLDAPEIRELAIAFNVPIIIHAKERDGSLRQLGNDKGIPVLLYETGEALRFDEMGIRTGIHGILGIMQHLDMIPTHSHKMKKRNTAFARTSYWIRAPYSGVLRLFKTLGKGIKKGEVLGVIANPTNSLEEHPLKAPLSGIIIGKNNLALVHEGAALLNIACYDDSELSTVQKQLENFQISVDDSDLYFEK